MFNKTANQKYVTCADIGGSHITAAVVNLTERSIVEHTRVRLPVDSAGSWAEILVTWADALKQSTMLLGAPVGRVALAMPGPFDYQNGISWITGLNKYESIYGLNIKAYLAAELDVERECILFRNDAEAFLHGEVFAGAGTGFKKIIGITLGTGLGSARSIDNITGDVNRGSSRFGDSIADDYMTTRWFIKRYAELTGKRLTNVKALAEIVRTDHAAEEVFGEFSNNLVTFLKDFINDEEPELLIIGGNIARASHLFLPFVRFQLAGYFDGIEIRIAELGEDSAIMGAASAFDAVLRTNNLTNQ